MGKMTLILAAVSIILLIMTALYMSKAASLQQQVDEGKELARTTKSLLRAYDIICRARETDFSGIRDCIKPTLIGLNFDVSQFNNFDTRRNESGALIITNKGELTYDGAKFTLKKNGQPIVDGCHISGDILPDYTCRFPLDELCEGGDVLEVTYTKMVEGEEREDRVVTKTC